MATVNVYSVTLNIRNEVTGEPHVHFYTTDIDKAMAYIYTVVEATGGRAEFQVYNVYEGVELFCPDCETARKRFDIAHEYGW